MVIFKVLDPVGVVVVVDVFDVELVPPTRVGIFVLIGVPSSLTRETEDNCLDPNFDVLGVKLDRVDVVSRETVAILDGVARPKEMESELSESALETLRAFAALY